jgi:hypothetical protein
VKTLEKEMQVVDGGHILLDWFIKRPRISSQFLVSGKQDLGKTIVTATPDPRPHIRSLSRCADAFSLGITRGLNLG